MRKPEFILLLVVLFFYLSLEKIGSSTNSKLIKEDIIKQLIKDIEQEDSIDKRCIAIRKLGDMRVKEVVPKLITFLDSKEWRVKFLTCIALGKISDNRAVLPLIKRLEDNKENCLIKVKSAEALANIYDPKAFKTLINALRYECEVKRENVYPPLTHTVGSDDEVIEMRMASALLNFVAKDRKKYIPLLLQFMNEEKKRSKFKYYIAEILGTLKEKESVPVLIEYLTKSENGLVRRTAAKLLGNLGDKRAIEPLKQALKDDYRAKSKDLQGVYRYSVRYTAAVSLKKLGLKIRRNGDHYEIID